MTIISGKYIKELLVSINTNEYDSQKAKFLDECRNVYHTINKRRKGEVE